MSYTHQHQPPTGQYSTYPPPQQQQQSGGQPWSAGAYGGYPPPPPQDSSSLPYGSGYAPPPGGPPPQPGGYMPPPGPPRPGGMYAPPSGGPPRSEGYAPPPGPPPPGGYSLTSGASPSGGYAPPGGPPQPEGYAPPPGAPISVLQQDQYAPPSAPPPHHGPGYNSSNFAPPPRQAYPPANTVPPSSQPSASQQTYGMPSPPHHPGYNPSYIAPPPPGQAYPPANTVPPPHQPYGGPPVPAEKYYPPTFAPQGYGGQPSLLQPSQQLQLMYLGTAIPPPPPEPPMSGAPAGFDAHRAAETVYKAMKGFGTDEAALTGTIAPLDAFQVEALRRTFEAMTGKNLVHAIEKETSSWYEHCLRAKVLGPVLYDCWLIHRACSGAGTREDIFIEILLGRSNSEIQTLKAAYRATYDHDLSSVIRSDLSGKTEQLFSIALVGNREEHEYVDQARVQSDMERIGSDEVTIRDIIATRSHAHLGALVKLYVEKYRQRLSIVIGNAASGHMGQALQFVARGAEDDGHGVFRDVEMIEEAMSGIGTKDERLIYRIIRAHWNYPRFNMIKQIFSIKYGKLLLTRVKGETSGDYRNFMCAIIGH